MFLGGYPEVLSLSEPAGKIGFSNPLVAFIVNPFLESNLLFLDCPVFEVHYKFFISQTSLEEMLMGVKANSG